MTRPSEYTRQNIMKAATALFAERGYDGTSIRAIVSKARVNQAAINYHFKGKEDLALAAAGHFAAMADSLFAQAPYQSIKDPLFRVLGYVDFRIAILKGSLPQYTCLLGTMVQETFETYPRVRDACNGGISAHAHTVALDIALAKAQYAPDAVWDPETVALYTQAVIQGAFILAKAQGSAAIAAQCIEQLRNHVATMLGATTQAIIKRE